MANWYTDVARYLSGFPGNYLVFDTETQGLAVESPRTLPTQVGFALIKNRKLDSFGSFYLNWCVGPAAVDPVWFQQSLRETAAAMEKKGKKYHGVWSTIEDEGVDPLLGLEQFRLLFSDCYAKGYSFVAHNGFAYDRPLLEHCWRRNGLSFEIDVERMVDTGLLVKCEQLQWTPPLPGSCLRRDWYRKIAAARSRVRWNLDVFCNEKYGLQSRHGLNPEEAHSAGYDSVVCHSLLEAMRERAESAGSAV